MEAEALAAAPADIDLLLKAAWTLRAAGDPAGARRHLLAARAIDARDLRVVKNLRAVAVAEKDAPAIAALNAELEDLEASELSGYQAREIADKSATADRLEQLVAMAAETWTHGGERRSGTSVIALLRTHPWDNDPLWPRHAPPPMAEGLIANFGELGRFRVGDPQEAVNKRLARSIPWQLPVAAFLHELALRCDPSAVMLDLGAEGGSHAIAMAMAFPGQVIAVEAEPAAFRQMAENLALSDCGRVNARNLACGPAPGAAPGPGEAKDADITTIDELVAATGKPLALLRIDAGRAGLAALHGAGTVIPKDRPIIIVDYQGEAPGREAGREARLPDPLASLGYQAVSLYRRVRLYLPPKLVVQPAAAKAGRAGLSKRTRSETFTEIFVDNKWGSAESVSGTGSTRQATGALVPQLLALISARNINVFIDAPCGDFNWSAPIAAAVGKYLGFDIVPQVIERARSRAASFAGKAEFALLDLVEGPVPRGDILMCRDCLVHLDLASAQRAIANMRASGTTWLLLTTFPDVEINREATTGRWRPVNLEKPPFNLPPPVQLIVERPGLKPHERFGVKALGLWSSEQLSRLAGGAGLGKPGQDFEE